MIGEEFRDRFKAAVHSCGLVYKSLPDLSGVPLGTINNWLRTPPKSPKAEDLASVAKVLGVTSEYLLFGISVTAWSPPPRIAALVRDLGELPDEDLGTVRAVVDGLLAKRRASGIRPGLASGG